MNKFPDFAQELNNIEPQKILIVDDLPDNLRLLSSTLKELLQQLDRALTSNNLQGHSLVLEITESMLVSNAESTRKLLESIEAKDICLSIDDFGTGYSCLSYLHHLPISYLKIDRTFVSSKSPNASNQVIAEAIIALSNLLELKTIAEGIETPQQLQWLNSLGCQLGQGFLFSPPVPAPMVTKLLQREFDGETWSFEEADIYAGWG